MSPSQQIVFGARPLPLLRAVSERRLPRPGRGVKTSPRRCTLFTRALRLVYPEPRRARPTTFAKRLQSSHSTSLSHFLFPLYFQRVTASLVVLKESSPLFSMRCLLLRKNMEVFLSSQESLVFPSCLVRFHLSPLPSINCKLFSHFSLHQNAATPLESIDSKLFAKQRRVYPFQSKISPLSFSVAHRTFLNPPLSPPLTLASPQHTIPPVRWRRPSQTSRGGTIR